MKLNVRKIIFITLIVIGIMFCLPESSFAGWQTLNNLEFKVDVQENGDINITEIWDVDLEDTNTLFKTFPKDTGYEGITNVTVSEIEDTKEIKFKRANKYEYHVEEDYYQALENPDGNFEIAWGVNSSYDTGRKFEISYTVKNHVFIYKDCAEIYWKLIGDDFEIFCNEITGTINLPDGITDMENLRVWAHGPLNGTIIKESVNKVKFYVTDLEAETFLEIRFAMPTEIFPLSIKKNDLDRLQTILAEETVFAEEANKKRIEWEARQELYCKIATVVLFIGIIIGGITLLINLKKLFTEKKIKPETDWEYYRDIPDKNATPSVASFIYYESLNTMHTTFSSIFSATLLSLALKGWISFGKKLEKKEQVQITINKTGKETLKQDEKEIYDYLSSLFEKETAFTIKEFEKKAKKNVEKFIELREKIIEYSKQVNEDNGIYNKKLHNKSLIYILELVLYLLFTPILSIISINYNFKLTLCFIIIAIINEIIAIPLMCRYNGFTQEGVNEAAKWKGLVKFMRDFSLIDKRKVPELVLWEKYLVYATAFCIADEVIKQLKVYFPEMSDEEYLRSHYTYMYFASSSDMNFIRSIDSSIGSVTNYASESGAGGGFSAGGGGGFGGGGGGGR